MPEILTEYKQYFENKFLLQNQTMFLGMSDATKQIKSKTCYFSVWVCYVEKDNYEF